MWMRLGGRERSVFAAALAAVASAGCATGTGDANPGVFDPSAAVEPFTQEIAGTAIRFEMVPIPPAGVEAGAGKAPPRFWIGKTEMTWEAFDIFVYGLDQQQGEGAAGVDATTRPSKPYLPPDRGFGHEGYPAISMTHHSAAEFCKWLSAKTGRTYRLATEAEWEYAARAGAATAYDFGDDPASLAQHAWFKDNADGKTHPAGKKKPNAWGVHDMLGNAAEWCSTPDGKGVTRGGAYTDPAERVRCDSRAEATPAWNASDPQIPKSKWWLADGPFVGFRVVCEAPASR